MTENLLQAPERGAIEGFLQKGSAGPGTATTFEGVLGFLTGAVITPGDFTPSDWLQPLFDLNGIVFSDVQDLENFVPSLVSLYNRVDAARLREEGLCPFDLKDLEVLDPLLALEWAAGLHSAVTLREEIWIPEEGEADYIPVKLKEDANINFQCLSTLVDPSTIPEVVPDPVPFQRNVLSHCPGWREDMLRETWNEELVQTFRMFCLGQLDRIIASLQRYATAYDEGW